MITDRLKKVVTVNNRIAISELKLNDSFVKSAHLVFATVLNVFSNYLVIKYDSGMVDDNFVSKEFIIIPNEEEKMIYNMSTIEVPLVGCLNVK